MREINGLGHVIDSIPKFNNIRKGSLPNGCFDCRFFEAYADNDPKTKERGDWCGECTLARGRLFRGGSNMDEIDCPLEHLEGVDERIWGFEPTGPWGRNYRAVDLSASGRKYKLDKINQLEAFLEDEKAELFKNMEFRNDPAIQADEGKSVTE